LRNGAEFKPKEASVKKIMRAKFKLKNGAKFKLKEMG